MAQLLLLVLCVKKAFCVKYTDFHCVYVALLAWCTSVERFVAKQQKNRR